jgi:glycosyltransferase involved in cell wall biosynthesis
LGEGSLRVAVVAPPWFDVPPAGYGGIEQMVGTLVDGLTDRGHEVSLVAAGEDRTDAALLRTFRSPPRGLGSSESLPIELIHAQRAERRLRDLDVDVIHDHTVVGPVFSRSRSAPTVVTVHGPVEGWMRRLYGELEQVSLVAISDAQRASAPELPWIATVPNAIDVAAMPFGAEKEDFLLFLGRVHPTKGILDAIRIARRAGRRLLIAAKASDDEERRYLAAEVEPELGDGVEFLGDADADRKLDLLVRARALLFPIRWEEPFGLVMIEAMACGTPVIAARRGSVPEVVEDGVTGLICDGEDDFVEACDRVAALDAETIRRRCAVRFDTARMTGGYEQVYRSLALRVSMPSGAPVR